MITLHDLIQSMILAPDDHLCFRYKDYPSLVKWTEGCSASANERRVFCDRLPFDSIDTGRLVHSTDCKRVRHSLLVVEARAA